MPWNEQPTAGTACWSSKGFMEIVYKTKLNSIQLNTLEIWDHVIVGGNEYTSFADRRLL